MTQRIRTVKPELFRHEALFDLEAETGLPVRLAFIGLFTCCDREGRFEWRARTLKSCVMPFDDVDFSRVLDALTTRGFIVRYRVGTREFGEIPGFSKHQVVNNREGSSKIPPTSEADEIIDGFTRQPRVSHASATPLVQDQGEGKGREGKGKESPAVRADARADMREGARLRSRVIEALGLTGNELNTSGSFIVGGMTPGEVAMHFSAWGQTGMSEDQIIDAITAKTAAMRATEPGWKPRAAKFFDGPIRDHAARMSGAKAAPKPAMTERDRKMAFYQRVIDQNTPKQAI